VLRERLDGESMTIGGTEFTLQPGIKEQWSRRRRTVAERLDHDRRAAVAVAAKASWTWPTRPTSRQGARTTARAAPRP
jgi:hypothetical protein